LFRSVDDGGYGVGADPDQLRTGVVGLLGLAVELLDECLDVGGHDAEWFRRQKVGSHQQSTKWSLDHGARSSAAQSSKESRVRSMGRQAGASGSSSAGGRTNRRPCSSQAPKFWWCRWGSTRETLFAPPAMVGQRNWTPSSSQKQTGQISYEPGIAPST